MEEATLDPQTGYWQHIQAGVTQATLLVDAERSILSATGAFEQLLGYTPNELIGQPLTALWPDAATLPKPGIHDITLRHRNSRLVPVTVHLIPEANHHGSCHVLAILNSSELQRMNEALSHTQRLAGVGTLTASVAHELTNPLSIITATCTNLMDEVDEASLSREQLLRYIQIIEESAFRSARIVNVLRNYAYMNGPESAVTDVDSILNDARTLVEQQFLKHSNVTIESSVSAELRSVVCDHHRITQVLVNLLTNARDAMQPDGGTIRIDVAPYQISAESPKQFILRVHDTGHGIAPENLPRLFEPFFTTKKAGQGTGLGLFIAKGIVEEHGGTISAENNPDRGATFTVILPQRQ